MDKNEFLLRQFIALRAEIEARQMRLFWIVAIGLLGVPILTYFASDADKLVWLLMPYFVLVLIIMFLAEQNAMMRAGRYIREQIEKNIDYSPGWEAWLESRPQFRMMEKHFFSCFIIVFFLYYFLAIGMAMQRLWGEAGGDPTGSYWYWFYGAVGTYAVGAVWATATLIQHWKSSVSTSTGTD